MNFFYDNDPIKDLPPKLKARSHYYIERGAKGGWILTVNRPMELPQVIFCPDYASVNRARLGLSGIPGFVKE